MAKKDFEKEQNLNNIINWILLLVTPIVFVILWQIFSDRGFIHSSIMPSPKKIVNTFFSLLNSGKLYQHLYVSVLRVLTGFAIGSLFGVTVGFLAGLFEKIDKATAVILGVLRPIPTIGLVPLFILWFGIGEQSKIILIAVGTFWAVWLNTENGIRSTNSKFLEVARMLEKGKLTVLMKIVLPASIPSIFTGLRLGLSAAWRSLVGAEMIAATRGIGFMISYSRELAQPDVMFVGLFVIGLVGIFIDVIILKVQQKLIYWG